MQLKISFGGLDFKIEIIQVLLLHSCGALDY
jgi:hypothetical protein